MFEKLKKNAMETSDDMPHYTCLVCRQDSLAYQISVFQEIEFLSCQTCGSVTTRPIPDQEFIDEALNASRTSQLPPFPSTIERKHFLRHIQELRSVSKTDRCLDLKPHNGVRTEMARIKAFPKIVGLESNPFSAEIAQKRFHKAKAIACVQ